MISQMHPIPASGNYKLRTNKRFFFNDFTTVTITNPCSKAAIFFLLFSCLFTFTFFYERPAVMTEVRNKLRGRVGSIPVFPVSRAYFE